MGLWTIVSMVSRSMMEIIVEVAMAIKNSVHSFSDKKTSFDGAVWSKIGLKRKNSGRRKPLKMTNSFG